jgi:hypothetical protein
MHEDGPPRDDRVINAQVALSYVESFNALATNIGQSTRHEGDPTMDRIQKNALRLLDAVTQRAITDLGPGETFGGPEGRVNMGFEGN